MSETQAPWTFFIASTAVSSSLASDVSRVMSQANHIPVNIRDDPRITFVLGLGQNIELSSTEDRDAMEWLREIVDGLLFGGSAIAFCPEHLNPDQLNLLDVNRLPEDHGARNHLLFAFHSIQELRERLAEIPQDFAAWPEDDDE